MSRASLSLPGMVWASASNIANWESPTMQIKQSSATVPSPRWVEWLFDDSQDEHLVTTLLIPNNYLGNPALYVYYKLVSATSSNVRWAARVHALTHTDGSDLDVDLFATSAAASGVVPATAGYMRVARILFLDLDNNMTAKDFVTLTLRRDQDHADDGASGDAEFIGADFRYEVL